MRILVTGVNGQLGFDVMKSLEKRKIECQGVDINDFDITDKEQTRAYICKYNPSVVIHCAAYTAVDKSEDEKELVYKVNVIGTKNIAEVCKEIDTVMVYISTDYVFPGTGDNFYEEEDATGPLSQYGLTKLQGEEAVRELLEKHFIVRISWVFGKNGNNFVKTMLRLGKEREELGVVGDQVGSPTYTYDVAELMCELIQTNKYGTYHATNEGTCSWAEFTEEIMKQVGYTTIVKAITTEEYPTKAVRPKNSRLSKDKLVANGFQRLPHWKDALKRFLEE